MDVFSLVQCVEDVEPLFLSGTATVESIEGIGNYLILGSGNGSVVSVTLLDDQESSERVFIQNSVSLPHGQPVTQLKALAILNRLLAVSDGSLYILTLDGLKLLGSPRMRSVSCMGINDDQERNGNKAISIAVGLRRRQIAVGELQADRINVSLELDTDDIPLQLVFEDRCICYGTSSHYYIIDLQKRITRPLFPVTNEENVHPVVRRIGKCEFLLTGLHDLGMFVTSDGVSNRPPISWDNDSPVDAVFSPPYVIVLSRNYLSIFSIEDQELKQKIPFPGGQCLCECDSGLFVGSERALFQMKLMNRDEKDGASSATAVVSDPSGISHDAPKVEKREEYSLRLPKIQERSNEWNEAMAPLFQKHCTMEHAMIGKSLAKARLQDSSIHEQQLGAVKFQLSEHDRCAVCDQLFVEPDCIRYPNGTLIHPNCLRHSNLCPATKEVFW